MRRRRTLAVFTILVCLLSVALAVLASGAPALVRWVFASGGGLSEGAGVTVNWTLGQAVIGPSAGQQVTLHAGYERAEPQAPLVQTYLPLIVHNR